MQALLLGIEIGARWPRYIILHVTPDPLDRAQLWAVRRQEHQLYVRWQGASRGRMRPAVVQSEDSQAIRKGLREGIDEALQPLRVPIRQLEKEPVTRGGLHRARDIAPLAAMRACSNRR